MKRLCVPFCALAYAFVLSAQSGLPKHVLQLAELKRNVKAELAAIPNYTCLETIERSHRKNAGQPFRHLDTVHIEVALAKDRELYSWPGANEFEDRNIAEIIGAGLISTGSFAMEIRNVLGDNVSAIIWRGEEEKFGRRTIRWEYRIPYNLSGWTATAGGHVGRVSAKGSFWVDADSLELLRLETNADDIPPSLPMTAVQSTLDYSPVHIGSRDLLLPQSAELILTGFTGEQSRNLIDFSHCREFAADARLTFEPQPAPGTTTRPVVELPLPPGLQLSVRLAHDVDSEHTAVGDAFSATVQSSVGNKSGTVISKGAVLRGRIRVLERYSTPIDHYIVGLEFTDLEFPGHHARFFGELDSVDPLSDLKSLTTSRTRTLDFAGRAGKITITEGETYRGRQIPGVSIFFIEGARFRLPEGLHMTWRTMEIAK